MTLYKWSQIASADASIDSSINWAEGQSPSSVNDSARAMMAATAKYRDDISGVIVTGGTPTAYTVASYQVFDTLAHMNGAMIAFTPHATNGAIVTLNVDGLGAKPLRPSPNVELAANSLILGTPYVAVYNNGDAVWYMQGGSGSANAYSIPLGAGLDYWGATTPNSIFAFPVGQAVSRSTYAALFSLIGTTYGAGDATTTFNLPDKTGRVSAMKEISAARLTATYFGGNSTNLGATGGGESTQLTLAQLPTGIASGGSNVISATYGRRIPNSGNAVYVDFAGSPGSGQRAPDNTSSLDFITMTGTNSIAVTSNNTNGNPHRTVSPTIICNYIMRVL